MQTNYSTSQLLSFFHNLGQIGPSTQTGRLSFSVVENRTYTCNIVYVDFDSKPNRSHMKSVEGILLRGNNVLVPVGVHVQNVYRIACYISVILLP